MARTRVLILDSDQGLLGPVVQSFQDFPQAELHVLTLDPTRTVRHSRFVRGAKFWPGAGDEARMLETLVQEIEAVQARVLLPLDEPGLALAARNRAELSRLVRLPLMPDPETLERCGDKWEFSRFMADRRIPQPRTSLVALERGGDSGFPFPAVIKKRKGSGGTGMRAFQSRDRLLVHLADLGRTLDGYLLQERLDGGEIDCSLLADQGRIVAHTIQRPLKPKTGFDFARAVEFVPDPQALDLAARLIAELDFSGLAHVDLIRDHRTRELKVLELNPRFWGTLVGSNLAGVNFAELVVRSALGPVPPVPPFREVSFAPAREALRMRLQALFSQSGLRIPWSQTNLRYYLADPRLILAKWLKKIFSLNRVRALGRTAPPPRPE